MNPRIVTWALAIAAVLTLVMVGADVNAASKTVTGQVISVTEDNIRVRTGDSQTLTIQLTKHTTYVQTAPGWVGTRLLPWMQEKHVDSKALRSGQRVLIQTEDETPSAARVVHIFA